MNKQVENLIKFNCRNLPKILIKVGNITYSGYIYMTQTKHLMTTKVESHLNNYYDNVQTYELGNSSLL